MAEAWNLCGIQWCWRRLTPRMPGIVSIISADEKSHWELQLPSQWISQLRNESPLCEFLEKFKYLLSNEVETELRVGSKVNVLWTDGKEWQATVLGDSVNDDCEHRVMVRYKSWKKHRSEWVSVEQIISLVPDSVGVVQKCKRTKLNADEMQVSHHTNAQVSNNLVAEESSSGGYRADSRLLGECAVEGWQPSAGGNPGRQDER